MHLFIHIFWRSSYIQIPIVNIGWMGAHNALRKEMTDIVNALNAVKSRGDMKSFEVTAMQALWKSHHDHVEAHHRNEDELFVPFLKERFAYPEKAVADHSELVKMFGVIRLPSYSRTII